MIDGGKYFISTLSRKALMKLPSSFLSFIIIFLFAVKEFFSFLTHGSTHEGKSWENQSTFLFSFNLKPLSKLYIPEVIEKKRFFSLSLGTFPNAGKRRIIYMRQPVVAFLFYTFDFLRRRGVLTFNGTKRLCSYF